MHQLLLLLVLDFSGPLIQLNHVRYIMNSIQYFPLALHKVAVLRAKKFIVVIEASAIEGRRGNTKGDHPCGTISTIIRQLFGPLTHYITI